MRPRRHKVLSGSEQEIVIAATREILLVCRDQLPPIFATRTKTERLMATVAIAVQAIMSEAAGVPGADDIAIAKAIGAGAGALARQGHPIKEPFIHEALEAGYREGRDGMTDRDGLQ